MDKRLNYTQIYYNGPRTKPSGAGKYAGKGLSNKKNIYPTQTQIPQMRMVDQDLNQNKEDFTKEIIRAILLYLNENLPTMLKRAINFNTNTTITSLSSSSKYPKVHISINPDYTDGYRSGGAIEFTENQVIVICMYHSSTEWEVGVDYADPELFEKIQVLLSRFYNHTYR